MLPTDNANGAAGGARLREGARTGRRLVPTVRLVHVRGAVRQKTALKTIELTGFDDQKWMRPCRAEDAPKRARLLLLEFADRGNREQLITDAYLTKQRRLSEAQISAAIAHVPRLPADLRRRPPRSSVPMLPDNSANGAQVQALRQHDHPNIIKFYASIKDEDVPKRGRLLLEYACRGNLEQFITDTYFTKQRRLLEAQITAAIAHVHERRILHRDLKPTHVLLDGPQMALKVCDFGLCRLFSQNAGRANTRVGTPYYVSPERSTQSGYSFASDVWSLGCILYEVNGFRSVAVRERTNDEFALYQHIRAGDFP
ncbi:Serine threonine-kinase Nek7 [Aphelenchoides fujianensis]|nr:Serine threonine-kinase Nek7 [Aphelenchoides fujianensis]